MPYYTDEELDLLGLKKVGKDVLISKKASLYNCDLIEIGDRSRIDDFCVISGKVKIGRNVHIAPHCLVAGGSEGIEFEDYAGIAYFVQVFSQSDDYSGAALTNPTVPAKYKLETKAPVKLKRHVIVGAASVVMPGVTIEEGCSVGAMSLVRKSTEPWGVYIGNPAKKIKNRSKKLLVLEKNYENSFQ